MLDVPGGAMLKHAARASCLGLIDLPAAGNVAEVFARALDPGFQP